MEANKISTTFVENFLNGCPFSSIDLNYEKPEVKKSICNYNLKSQFNGTCPMKPALVETNGSINGTTNGHHSNGHVHEKDQLNGKTNGHMNGHSNGVLTMNGNGHINNGHSRSHNSSAKQKSPLIYGDYLMLDKLLACQEPITRTMKEVEAHDEHLFIVTHQSYEIWFKQILFELSSVMRLISKKIETKTDHNFTGEYVLTIRDRLHRITVILKHLVNQWDILETMNPIGFVEFRAYLRPASGFQSLQFRLMENKLGIRNEKRTPYGQCNYMKVFQDKNKVNSIKNSENEPSLHDLINRWLELDSTADAFIEQYMKAVNRMFKDLETEISETNDEEMKSQLLDQYIKKKQLFDQLTNEKRYNQLLERGDRRLSFKAFKSTLSIFVNKDNSNYSMMFQIINLLQDIDTQFIKWRANHVHIVLKMIGTDLKGTGGSSGYQYLRRTLNDNYKVFTDFFNIGSYLISEEYLIEQDDE